jgi:predicted acylesterase/phospholipase RssA
MFARRNAVAELPHADVVISVDIEGIQLYDMQKHEELVARGRKACKAKIAEIRRRLEGL